MTNDFLTATKNTPSQKWPTAEGCRSMHDKPEVFLGRGFRVCARSRQSLWVVDLATTTTPQNPAALAAEAPPSRSPRRLFSPDINRSSHERLQPLMYRFCFSDSDLTAGTFGRFSFRAPARFHFGSPHNFAAAFRFLAPFIAPSPRQFPPSRRRPPRLVALPSARDAQRVRRNIFRDRGPRRDVRAVANPHRRHQRAVTPDENPIANPRFVLRHAIVVASDGPRADVRFAPDGRITQISQMPGLRALMHHRIFHFNKISNVRACANIRPRTQSRKRPHVRPVPHTAGIQRRMRPDDYFIVQASVAQHAPRLNRAARPDARLAQQLHARLDHRVRPRAHFRINH